MVVKKLIIFFGLALIVNSSLWSQSKTIKPTKAVVSKQAATTTTPTEVKLLIETPFGNMVAKLYNETPLHRDNFLKLIDQQFYDSLLFHRVIKNFMIQGGDPTSKYADSITPVGSGSAPGERIPAEFQNKFFHKKGALAAARDNNPERASSNCQFYIVQGKKYDSTEIKSVLSRVLAANPSFNYQKQQLEVYERIGGTPFLDQSYTVFGEVISGLEVIDKIAEQKTKPGDRPIKDIRMKISRLAI
ncbi:MAG: peptidylprolyl isomerase, partial [Chitinophagaceae bacterium]